MLRSIFLFVLLFATVPAWAGKIAVVDFQRAVQETEKGKSAQKQIDAMYDSRKGEIEKMQSSLEKEIQDFQSRAMILSEQARAEQEQQLIMKQQRFQQTYMQYENELQQTYSTLLSDLDQKMRTLSAVIAKEKGYDLVIDRQVVVHQGGEVIDMTGDLVARFNQTHK